MNIKTKRMPMLFGSVLALLVLFGAAGAAMGGYGTSSIGMTPSNATVMQGQSTHFGYIVSLATGGTWGTNLEVSNQAQLSSEGISVGLTTASGDPTFSGVATVNVSQIAAPGSYNVTFVATGDDPSAPASFVLTVTAAPSSGGSSNSTVNTTTIAVGSANSTTIPTTTTVQQAYNGSSTGQQNSTITPIYKTQGTPYGLYVVYAMVVVLVITVGMWAKVKFSK